MATPASESSNLSASDLFTKVKHFGLGFGVDVTKLAPLQERSAYQVCHIKEESDSLITTDRGGSWNTFENEVYSHHEMGIQFKASVTLPNSPIVIDVEAELSRDDICTRKSFGKKIIDKEVAINPDKVDIEGPETFENRLVAFVGSRIRHHTRVIELASEKLNKKPHQLTFDDLNAYMNEKMQCGLEKGEIELALQSARLIHLFKKKPGSEENPFTLQTVQKIDWNFLIELCKEFIRQHRCTHYITSLELGASEYRIITEQQKDPPKGLKLELGVQSVAQVSAKIGNLRKKFGKEESRKEVSRLGTFKKESDEVERPAVLKAAILPITHRVEDPLLRMSLQSALTSYCEERYNQLEHQHELGPFRLCIPDMQEGQKPKRGLQDLKRKFVKEEEIDTTTHHESQDASRGESAWECYLKVKRADSPYKYALIGDSNPENASIFYIIRGGEDVKNEFYIAYYGDGSPTSGSLPYYLQLSSKGDKKGPLYLKPAVDRDSCAFVFVSQDKSVKQSFMDKVFANRQPFLILLARCTKEKAVYVHKTANEFTTRIKETGSKPWHTWGIPQEDRFLFKLEKVDEDQTEEDTDQEEVDNDRGIMDK